MPCRYHNHHDQLNWSNDKNINLSNSTSNNNNNPLAPVSGFASPTALPQYGPQLLLCPVHMTLHLDFTDLSSRSLHGFNTLTIKNTSANHTPSVTGTSSSTENDSSTLATAMYTPWAARTLLNSIALDAVSLNILSVSSALPVSHTYDGKVLNIRWDKPFGPSESRDVTVEWMANNPITGIYYHLPDPAQFSHRVPHVVTDHESEKARYWLPCMDTPSVRTTLEFHLKTQQNHTAIANGAETSVVLNDDNTKTTVYALKDHVCPSYLIALMVGDLTEAIDEAVDGMPIRYYAPSNYTKEQLMLTFEKTPSMVRWLQRKVGRKFPWPKYHQICSQEILGAMENITLVTYTDSYCLDERRAREIRMNVDSTNIHEMAHTYFGDLLVIRHFEHAWLKESWATYIESCWREDHLSHEEYRYDLFLNSQEYFNECEDYMRPIVCKVYENSWSMFDRHLYPGGAMRLHMLRQLMGDDAFWAGVQGLCQNYHEVNNNHEIAYVNEYASKSVETDDFRRCLERSSGLNLIQFFDQWIYSPGYPKIKVSHKHHSDGNVVEVTFEQTQSATNGVPSVFAVAMEVDVIDADGHAHVGVVEFTADGARSKTCYVSLGKAKPAMIEVDPRGKVLHTLEFSPGEEMCGATIKGGRDIASRIHAYNELIKEGTSTAMAKVREQLPHEQFRGVRAQVYDALAKSYSYHAMDILVESHMRETHPQALVSLLRAATRRDPKLRETLSSLIARPSEEFGYIARSLLFENLGRQRHPDDLAVLLRALEAPEEMGMNGLIWMGVLKGLGFHRSRAALDALRKCIGDMYTPGTLFGACGGVVERDRIAHIAIMALAEIASYGADAEGDEGVKQVKRDAIERIAEIGLTDTRYRVRRASVQALGKLGARNRAAQVEATVKQTFPHQELPEFKGTLKKLNSSPPASDGGKGAEKKLEEMEEKLKKLEKLVESLERKDQVREAAAKAAKPAEALDAVDGAAAADPAASVPATAPTVAK